MTFKENVWADYEIANSSKAPRAELQKAVRRAAKAANQRMLRLERHGMEKRTAYGIAQRYFKDSGRNRYKERPDKLTYNELQKEYRALRSFLSAKSSTVQGALGIERKRYETARSRGYKGTFEQFRLDVAKAFSRHNEQLFSSDILYRSLTGGDLDIIDAVVKRYDDENDHRGEALLLYMKRKRQKEARNNRKLKRKKE